MENPLPASVQAAQLHLALPQTGHEMLWPVTTDAANFYNIDLIMSPIYLIEGPVGAGKSTFALSLASQLQTTHIALDEWFARLFSPDRPHENAIAWYLQRKDRLLDVIWMHALAMASADQTPILELGLIQRQARYELYAKAQEAGIALKVYVLDADIEIRRRRVQQRNEKRGATFSMVVPDHIFDLASNMWEAPDDDEIADVGINVLNTEKPD